MEEQSCLVVDRAFISIFSGTFVSTTPGANLGCGVDGIPDTWPLCGGNLVDPLEDLVLQSQMIHRWLVGGMLVAMVASSYLIWKESEEGSAHILRIGYSHQPDYSLLMLQLEQFT